MKNIFSIALILSCILCGYSVSAQHTTPRYSTTSNGNKTFSNLSLGLFVIGDTLGATVDTVLISPNVFQNNVYFTLADSCVLAFEYITDCYLFDNMNINIQAGAGAGKFVNFLGYSGLATKWGMSSTGTKISVAASKSATLSFIFNGVLWDEKSRSIR